MNFLKMFPKSIKWRLQIWYGLILVFVLAGFGFTAYQLERGRLFGRIDDELHRRVEVLAGALRRPPPHGPDGERAAISTVRRPASCPKTVRRRDRIRVRHANFICRRKLRII